MKIQRTLSHLTRVAMTGCRRLAATALMTALLATVGAGAAQAGCLTGWNTVDYLTINPALAQGTFVHYTVSTTGTGSNKLTVKVQQQKSGGDWVTIDDIKIDAGHTDSGTFTVQDYYSGSLEMVRFRLSRDLGTKEICYSVSWY